MKSIPEKIYFHLGYNNLGLILDQERKHWLMKVDKHVQVQDKTTGEIFQGTVDNNGSDIIIESEKLSEESIISSMKYTDESLNKMLSISNSAFTFSYEVNGLMFARITSINYQTSSATNPVEHHTYRIVFPTCTECIIPFGGSSDTDAMFADKWLKTTTTPYIQIMDDQGNYTTDIPLVLEGCTNGIYYYPLNEMIQPFPVHRNGTTYTSDSISDNEYIGFPLYWFRCDESINGPVVTVENNESVNHSQLTFFGNPGNGSMYNVNMYTCIDGDNDATPDDSLTSAFVITCSPLSGTFDNGPTDFNKAIDPSSISMKNSTTDEVYNLGVSFGDGQSSTIKMHNVTGWTYIDPNTYEIQMSVFDSNCLANGTNPLVPAFDISLDNSIPFTSYDETDTGYAGIRMGSNPSSDTTDKYPYQLNQWDGLPSWFTETSDDTVPEHNVLYAIHNTPNYVESQPDSRQVAALILDPGKKKTSVGEGLENDERGRVYIISNDDTTYRNNIAEKDKPDGLYKPERTAARICDIPTSVMELSGISGLSPDPVVDKKYIRSYASYDESDKNRLWNEVNWMNRWVRPSAKDVNGEPITNQTLQSNDNYVFYNEDMLHMVDMNYYNDFKRIENLNPYVDNDEVELSSITEPGSGYHVIDKGKIVVGGFTYMYEVQEVDENGGVVSLSIGSDSDLPINLANFDMAPGTTGITNEYGTSPIDPSTSGTGLKVKLRIKHYEDLLPKKGDYLDSLHAYVRNHDGIWLYEFGEVDGGYGWKKICIISPFERSSVNIDEGLSTPDAYMSSIVPTFSKIKVSQLNQPLPSYINAYSTASFMNIIDTTHTPVTPNESSSQDDPVQFIKVDVCGFRSDGLKTGIQATEKSVNGVIAALEEAGVLIYDSYVIWKWVNPNDPRDLTFTYAVIVRSMNNYLSTDETTKLPTNDLPYKKYVHANNNTTVVWDAPGVVGVMMWVYDISSTTKETYIVDPSTQDLYADRAEFDWNDIIPGVQIIDDQHIFQWNIITNNPIGQSVSSDDPIYQQPKFRTIVSIGNSFDTKHVLPTGNWKLVFPRLESFKLSNGITGTTYKPVKLQMVRGENLPTLGNFTDEKGNIVNAKTLVVNQTSNGLALNVFNDVTGRWENV